jgi:phospholipid-transporting ATPase
VQSAFRFADNRLLKHLQTHPEPSVRKDIDELLTLLAVCHTVVPEYVDEEKGASDKNAPVKYQAASPDELSLVLAASELQYYFVSREPVKFNIKGLAEINGQRVRVNIMGQEHDFSVLEILEFNSTRKRMSVIVLDPRDKKIKIYCKGADNVIRERTAKKSLAERWKPTEKHLQDFAVEGLRTLCCGYRAIPKKEFKEWLEVRRAGRQRAARGRLTVCLRA